MPFKTESVGPRSYQPVSFRIDNFLNFQNPTAKSSSPKENARLKYSWFDKNNSCLIRSLLFIKIKIKQTNRIESIKIFMENSCQKIHLKSKGGKAEWNLNTKGLLLRLASKSSSNY